MQATGFCKSFFLHQLTDWLHAAGEGDEGAGDVRIEAHLAKVSIRFQIIINTVDHQLKITHKRACLKRFD